MTSPSLYWRFCTASNASSSQSKQRAGPLNLSLSMPAILTIAPSGARLPFRPTTPPVLLSGLVVVRTTSWSSGNFTFSSSSPIDLPETLRQSPSR